jgi:hypothetical protein
MDDNGMPFLYVYATTHNCVTTVFGQAVYMGIEDTAKMLGPLGNLCRVTRAQDLTSPSITITAHYDGF